MAFRIVADRSGCVPCNAARKVHALRSGRVPVYPDWFYYPAHDAPPAWVSEFVGVVEAARASIESRSIASLTSDRVLSLLRDSGCHLGDPAARR